MYSGSLKFNGYSVEKMEYRKKKDKGEKIDYNISPQVMTKITFKDEKLNLANLIVGIRLGYEDDLPFQLEVIIRGYFSLDIENLDKEEIMKFYLQNGTAILYPYIRSTVTYLSGTGNYNPIILPTVNFYKMIKSSDSAIIDSEEYEDY